MEEIKKMCVLLMRRMLCATLKLAGSACFGIVLLLTGLSAFFFVAGHDVNPPDVSDLMPLAPPPIEQSENVVPVLMDATNCLVLANSDMTLVNFYRSKNWDRKIWLDATNCVVLTEQEATTLVDRILVTNAALFAMLDVAVSRPRAQYPAGLELNFVIPELLETSVYSTLWSFESAAFWYGGLVALRARRLRENGRSDLAVEEMLRYGEMFARLSYGIESPTCILWLRSPCGPIVGELVDTAVKENLADDMCVRIDAACVRWAQMRHEAWKKIYFYATWRCRNSLIRDRALIYDSLYPKKFFEIMHDLHDCMWAATLAKGMEWAARSFPGYERYAFQPNRTLAEWASTMRETRPLVFALPYTADTRTQLARIEKSQYNIFHPLRRNCVGSNLLARYNATGFWRTVGKTAFLDCATRVVIAAARYRRKYGSLPPTLETLVPEFLAEVPHDPFDRSRPLGYDLEQGTIHTVGAKGAFHGKIPRYGGLRGDCYPYIRRIDGQAL